MTEQASFPGAAGARVPIGELKSGQAVDGAYACSEKTAATDRNGKAYLRLKLRDASGEVAAIHFDPSDEALAASAPETSSSSAAPTACTPSTGPRFRSGVARLGRGRSTTPATSCPSRRSAPATAEPACARAGDSVEEPHLRDLLERAFDGSREPGATFAVAPAAVRNHHAYRHGLLEHSLIVAEAATGVASRFETVDRDLVAAGALLHDIGKTQAYTSGGMATADDRHRPAARRDRRGSRHGT